MQNRLTISNIALDDLLSDVFGKTSTNIIKHLLSNASEKLTDISTFRSKGMKATNEKVLSAVDSCICAEQTEKMRIIHSHMDNLVLCKLNLQSITLSVSQKYLPKLNFVLKVLVIKTFSAITVISGIIVDMSEFPTSKHLFS